MAHVGNPRDAEDLTSQTFMAALEGILGCKIPEEAAESFTVREILVTDLSQDVFYARIVIDQDGRTLEIDSRPSDAIICSSDPPGKSTLPIESTKSVSPVKA